MLPLGLPWGAARSPWALTGSLLGSIWRPKVTQLAPGVGSGRGVLLCWFLWPGHSAGVALPPVPSWVVFQKASLLFLYTQVDTTTPPRHNYFKHTTHMVSMSDDKDALSQPCLQTGVSDTIKKTSKNPVRQGMWLFFLQVFLFCAVSEATHSLNQCRFNGIMGLGHGPWPMLLEAGTPTHLARHPCAQSHMPLASPGASEIASHGRHLRMWHYGAGHVHRTSGACSRRSSIRPARMQAMEA